MRQAVIEALRPLIGETAAHIVAPSWFTFIGLAGVVASALMLRSAQRDGMDRRAVASTLIIIYVAAVLGGILGPMLWDSVTFYIETGRHRFRWAGMTSFAGYAAGGAAAYWYLRRVDISPLRFGDRAAAPAGVGLAIARLGCFVAGCDYGQVTSLPWAVRFPAGSSAWRDHVRSGWLSPERAESLPVHPTQLYEALLGIAICVGALLLARTAWARRRDGRLLTFAVGAYAIGRFGIELLRGDAGRGLVAGVSTGQLICIALVLLVVAAQWFPRPWRLAPIAILILAASAGAARADDGPQDPYAPDAQPGQEPVPADPPSAPQPQPGPPVPQRLPPPGPPPPAAVPPAAYETAPPQRRYELSLLLGSSSAFNRNDNQVPTLGGISLGGLLLVSPSAAIGFDLDSMANEVAAHRSVMIAGELRAQRSPMFSFGLRAGLGLTLVDFDDPAFDDVLAPGARVSLTGSWAFADAWALVVAPIGLDLISHREIGGAITSYQFRIGVAYRPGARQSAGPGDLRQSTRRPNDSNNADGKPSTTSGTR